MGVGINVICKVSLILTSAISVLPERWYCCASGFERKFHKSATTDSILQNGISSLWLKGSLSMVALIHGVVFEFFLVCIFLMRGWNNEGGYIWIESSNCERNMF